MDNALIALIQAQAGREQLASQRYLSWALAANQMGYPGAQAWLESASPEELTHRDKWLTLLVDYADILPQAPEAPGFREQPASLLALFRAVLELENSVTGYIRAISRAAQKTEQEEVVAFCVWFLLEQISSVSEVQTIIRQLATAGDNQAAIYAIDALLAEAAKG